MCRLLKIHLLYYQRNYQKNLIFSKFMLVCEDEMTTKVKDKYFGIKIHTYQPLAWKFILLIIDILTR
jgi:hypothetical protein